MDRSHLLRLLIHFLLNLERSALILFSLLNQFIYDCLQLLDLFALKGNYTLKPFCFLLTEFEKFLIVFSLIFDKLCQLFIGALNFALKHTLLIIQGANNLFKAFLFPL